AMILASIVEKETGVAAERRRVAGVFVNRLRRGMRLQSDPTVIYGLAPDSGELGRPLSRADLAKPTPFNTYVIDRLPPAPICNPGQEAIAAVLNPLETADLYFVADGTGGHAFAETLREHNRNVAAWRRVQREGRSN
ncbi:MAG: endolytic transglycosylase MltG, partial [Rhodospirillaceae bacterium]